MRQKFVTLEDLPVVTSKDGKFFIKRDGEKTETEINQFITLMRTDQPKLRAEEQGEQDDDHPYFEVEILPFVSMNVGTNEDFEGNFEGFEIEFLEPDEADKDDLKRDIQQFKQLFPKVIKKFGQKIRFKLMEE